MWCVYCDNDAVACVCEDLDERCKKLSQRAKLKYRRCNLCYKSYAACECDDPEWFLVKAILDE